MTAFEESEDIEFKKTINEVKQGVISLSAMLNKHGKGTVFFGIANDGKPNLDFLVESDTKKIIAAAISENIYPRVTPNISIIKHDGKNVIEVAAEGNNKPYIAYGRYYIRSDKDDVLMTSNQFLPMLESRCSEIDRWETKPSGHGIESISEDVLIRYVDESNETGRLTFMYRDMTDTLGRLKLLSYDGKLNNAGYYLFSMENPMGLRLTTYDDDEMQSPLSIGDLQGNIMECIEEGVEFIVSTTAQMDGKLGVKRTKVPIRAIREAVVNCFTHMRYNTQPGCEIGISPSRVCIINPGSMPYGTDPQMFAEGKQQSILRNTRIAEVLYFKGTIDRFGTGFKTIFEECDKANVGYTYEDSAEGFKIIFERRPAPEDAPKDAPEEANEDVIEDTNEDIIEDTTVEEKEVPVKVEVSDRESKILALMSADPHVTLKSIRQSTGWTEGDVNGIIKTLKSKGLIRRTGARKNGSWIVLE
jgi:ATP-dependent DNA helicase RecG